MPEVEEVPLDIQLPEHSIGMVLMQPFIELNLAEEPFKWQVNRIATQIDRIKATLELARGGCGLDGVNFTIFPEYSIPGLDGVAIIEAALSDDAWPPNSVIIGGVDGLNKAEYLQLCEGSTVHPLNSPDQVGAHEWVNCCITWVESGHSGLHRWIQPKLAPAQLENNVTANPMYRGRAVYVFRCSFHLQHNPECRFLSLICFDWIDQHAGLWPVLDRYTRASTSTREIDILFVPQYNPEPNHNLFLENARRYFEEQVQYPTLNRVGGSVVFANAAGGATPGKHTNFGFSSLVFHPNASYDRYGCPPTFAIDTSKLRAHNNLTRCRQALFREMGPCVHSFGLRLPRWITPNPSDRGHPLESARIFPLEGDYEEDPRMPGRSVSAIVKWFNDNLGWTDCLIDEATHCLKEDFNRSRQTVIDETRRRPAKDLENSINILSVAIGSGKHSNGGLDAAAAKKWVSIGGERRVHNVDNWDAEEEECLKFLVNALSVLRLCKPIEIAASPTHARMRIGNSIYDIVVVCGPSHSECDEHIDRISYRASAARTLIAFTVDLGHQRRRPPRSKDIVDVADPSARDISSSPRRFYSYVDLTEAVSNATDLAGVCNHIDEVLGL